VRNDAGGQDCGAWVYQPFKIILSYRYAVNRPIETVAINTQIDPREKLFGCDALYIVTEIVRSIGKCSVFLAAIDGSKNRWPRRLGALEHR